MLNGATYTLLAAITFNSVYTLDKTCFKRLCHGPKFGQSDCCKGFICVALYKPGAEDVLECVDEEEHFRVKTMEEILEEVDREFGEIVRTDLYQNLTMLLTDNSLNSYMLKMRDLEDSMFGLVNFDNPVVLEYKPSNVSI